jgi:hypothetical protein
MLPLVLVLVGLISLDAPAAVDTEPPVSYVKDIRPILETSCVECHNEEDASSELIVTSVPLMLKGGKRGGAIAPGSPEDSLLIQFIKGLRRPQMPMDADLPAEQVVLIERWIKEGAKDDTPRNPRPGRP